MEFTALWDNVNLASRLEWVNKFYGTYICVSEDVVNQTKDNFSYRYLDKIRVKWKDQPVVIYELLARKGCLTEKRKATILKFTQWIKCYLSQDFEEAVKYIYNTNGRVIVTGIGKSANIATKIVATLNSTGTPALFMIVLAWLLEPIDSMDAAGGPINMRLFALQSAGNLAFSDRKPYPGCIAWAPEVLAISTIVSSLR